MIKQYINELADLKSNGQYRQLRECHALGDAWVEVNGRQMLNFSSNDYLGLATDNELVAEFEATLLPMDLGNPYGACSSRLLAGNSPYHIQVEEQLGTIYQRSALFFNSGYHANMGILAALANKGDLVLSDKLVHASLIDGIRLCAADHLRYRHNDYNQLRHLLEQKRHLYNNVFIVTESVFSMDGDSADLRQLVQLKNEFKSQLYVDEAHAVGVFGQKGLGLAEELNVLNDIDIVVGTMGKAWASIGAFAVTGASTKEWLINKCRTLIFTTALPPINMAWTLYILQQNQCFAHRRETLKALITQCQKRLRELGYATTLHSHIVPIPVGDDQRAVDLSQQLMDNGFFALPIRPPTVPKGTARLRLSLTANMNEAHINQLMDALGQYITTKTPIRQ
jgi:8-amino-7-oxononanoate synthase